MDVISNPSMPPKKMLTNPGLKSKKEKKGKKDHYFFTSFVSKSCKRFGGGWGDNEPLTELVTKFESIF